MRKATNSQVSNIEVDVTRPPDSGARRNENDGEATTVSITGSGGTSVVATNNSTGKWYLNHVTCQAFASAGTVAVEIQVRDSNDNVIVDGITDVADGYIPFDGQVVKSGWDIFADVTQDDANSYTVTIKPNIRKPSPNSGTDGTEPATVYEDFERSSPLDEYSIDTAAFGTDTTNPYFNATRLALTTTDTDTEKYINTAPGDGLPQYLSDPWKYRVYIASDYSSNETQSTSVRISHLSGNDGGGRSNGAKLTYVLGNEKFLLSSGGSVVDEEAGALSYTSGDWIGFEADYDSGRNPKFQARLLDAGGSIVATLTGNIDPPGDGWGFLGEKVDSGKDHYYDYMTQV